MTNTQRNSTAIAIVLALILGFGYYFMHKLQKEETLIKGKNQELKAEIDKFDKMLANREKIERDYAELQLMIAQQSKVMAQMDTPAITYNYLLQLLKWMQRNINFDFALSAKKAPEANWHEYIVQGRTSYLSAVNFIKQLEYQRPVLTIDEVTMAEETSAVSDTVNFSVVFKTHYTPDGVAMNTLQEKKLPAYTSNFVSFRPKIYETPPDMDIDPNLVRIDKAIIVGITESRAFLRDERGIIHILSIGDPVAYGYLYSIDLKQEKIVFRINQYGSTEDKTLFMQKTTK